VTDDGSTFWEPAAAQKGTLFARSYYQFAVFALVTFYSGRLRRRFGRQNVAVLIDIEDGFAIRIAATSEERAEPAVFVHHRFAADVTFMFAHLLFEHFAFFIAGGSEFTVRID